MPLFACRFLLATSTFLLLSTSPHSSLFNNNVDNSAYTASTPFCSASSAAASSVRNHLQRAALRLGRWAESSQRQLGRLNAVITGKTDDYEYADRETIRRIKLGEQDPDSPNDSSDSSTSFLLSDPLSPKQVRLAYLPDGMTVSWTTRDTFDEEEELKVYYSQSQDALQRFIQADSEVEGNDTTNDVQSVVGGQTTTYGTAYFHNVLLHNLKPATTFYYTVPHTTNIYSFTTAPETGQPQQPLTVFINGDCGLDDGRDVIEAMLQNVDSVDFYWHIGDISYADDWYLRPGEEYEKIWNKWMHLMSPVMSLRPYMVLAGNHEVTCSEAMPFACPQHQRNFTAYLHRFRMPAPESHALNNMWYSFDHGLVHFISLNTETDFPNAPSGTGTWLGGGPFGDQLAWLKEDLKGAVANRNKVPWIIVGGHRPFYTSRPKAACQPCKQAFEQLFIDAGVDIYMSGHVHWMERIAIVKPGGEVIANHYINPQYPIYLINGAGGNVEGHPDKQSHEPFTKFLNHAEFGYSLLKVYNATHADYEFIGAETRQLLDRITIIKDRQHQKL